VSGELVVAGELVPAIGGAIDLEEWASRMTHAGSIARAIAPTPFIPRSLRVYFRPENSNRDEIDVPATTAAVAAAVLTGLEVGLSPLAALRSIDIIEGVPALRAMALRALILRAEHDMWVVESTATRAIVAGKRGGSTHEQSSTWTLDRAKVAQLTGKTNWQRHPGAMLVARATAEVARLIAPDVLLGLPYAVEELADGDIVDDAEEVAAPPARPRTAQRKAMPKPIAPADAGVVEDDPPFDGDDPENPIPAHTAPTGEPSIPVEGTGSGAGSRNRGADPGGSARVVVGGDNHVGEAAGRGGGDHRPPGRRPDRHVRGGGGRGPRGRCPPGPAPRGAAGSGGRRCDAGG
jgi:hypothetical protein